MVKAADMHEADYSPWEGRDLACWPSMTLLRGKVVVDHGKLIALGTPRQLKERSANTTRAPPSARTVKVAAAPPCR